jgi:hypothetical protein
MQRREFIRSALAAGVLAALVGATAARPENGDLRVDEHGAIHHYWWDGAWYPSRTATWPERPLIPDEQFHIADQGSHWARALAQVADRYAWA